MKRKKEMETETKIWVHNHPDYIQEFVEMPVCDIVELLDALKIREYAQVFPTVSFQDALTELFPALGKRVESNPEEYGITRAEVKKEKAKVLQERAEQIHKRDAIRKKGISSQGSVSDKSIPDPSQNAATTTKAKEGTQIIEGYS